MRAHRKQRVPKLSFTSNRGIGWHVSYRSSETGMPKKHRFGLKQRSDKAEAERLYSIWLSDYLNGKTPKTVLSRAEPVHSAQAISTDQVRPGCLLEVANSLLNYEQSRMRDADSPRERGKIHPDVYRYRCYYTRKFLQHINATCGHGSVAQLRVDDLTMQQVEQYNRELVEHGLSSSAIKHAMQSVRHLILRAGRPEHGQQLIRWNWDSRDQFHGRAKRQRKLPTLDQLQRLLQAADPRGRTLIWTAIGLGFGASDLSALRVGQIDAQSYDLRRGKTGNDRYGDTPPLVWAYLNHHIAETGRSQGELVFRSLSGLPLASGRVNRLQNWWIDLRDQIDESKHTMSGFYVLRHLGATEFGSRPSCSISEMRRWLGHATSSAVADVYMRPIAPEYRQLIEWVRERLASTQLDSGESVI